MKYLVLTALVICQLKDNPALKFKINYRPPPEGGLASIVFMGRTFDQELEENELGEAYPAGTYHARSTDGLEIYIDIAEDGSGTATLGSHTSQVSCVSE